MSFKDITVYVFNDFGICMGQIIVFDIHNKIRPKSLQSSRPFF